MRIVLLLEGGVGGATLDEGAEAADPGADLLTLVLAQHARQQEQLQRLLQGDGVHGLAGAQGSELRLLLGVFGSAANRGVRPVAAQPHAHRLAGLGIGPQLASAGGLAAVDGFDLVVHQLLERPPELLHERHPVLLAAADRVQLVLQPGGEVVVHVTGEMAGQELGHRPPDVRGAEAAALQLHVLAVLQGLDDRGVGGGAADAVFLQRLHQRGLRIARGRLGEVLVGVHALQRHLVAGLHHRQLAAFVVVIGALGVLALLVHRQEAREDHRGAAGAEPVVAAGGQVHRDRVEGGRHHLAGHGALPDQLVQAAAVVIQVARHLGRGAQGGTGPDRLVGFLGVLGLGLVEVRLVGHRSGAEVARDHVADLAERIGRQAHRVGTHVGDQAHRAFLAQRHALVELLRHPHGAAGGEAELARGLLLQGRGGEGRGRAALALLAGDVGDVERAAGSRGDALAGGLGGFAIGNGELLELLPVQAHQLGGERLRGMGELGGDRPVLAALEGLDLLFALDDHAQRRRLHAPGRKPALDLAPQHRREVEAHKVVQRPACLLGIDQRAGDLARVGHRLLDGTRGDLGEHHPVQVLVLEQAALAQDLHDVPADRLALAVRVGGQVDAVGLGGGLGDRLHVLLVLVDQVVAHPEAVLRIHRALLGHQVAHMAVGGQDLEVLAEVLVDRLGLGGRLDDEEVLGHWYPL